MKEAYFDLGSQSEDQQIQIIGAQCRTGNKVGFIVMDKPRTIARYIAKLQREFPDVIVTKLGRLTKGTFALRAELHTQGRN